MIKIKNYIFNEKEIASIEPISDGLRVDLKSKSDYIDIYATVDDIEWNYGTQKRTQEHTIRKGVCDKNKKPLLTIEDIQLYIQELEEENERLKFCMQDTYDSANDICGELQQRIDKSIKLTEELYKMAKEQDSDNVNLIDRLEIILKTLKGE